MHQGCWSITNNGTVFGSLPYELTEGDILIIFSQYGIPVHLKLVRDKETGKSKGFGYLKYEDQRSTVLAVDNLNGTKILGRIIRVDHTYYEERERDEEYEKLLEEELKNDFADLDQEDDVKEEKPEDDEFQDPLLLMQKKEESERITDKKRHRDHKDREHTHRSSHRSSHRENHRDDERSSEHRERKHKDDQEHHRSDHREKRIRKEGESERSRSHRHHSSKDKRDYKTEDQSSPNK